MRNSGLDAVNAAHGYAAGMTGAGVRVAIVDSGIDVNNPEFVGAIDSNSTNIVSGSSTDLQDPHGHGTAVAGVIRATRNQIGMHGIAYDSTILAIRTDTPGSCGGGVCQFAQADLMNATAYAVSKGAKVINYSLGGAAPSAAFAAALTNASMSAVLVAAAGNTGAADPIDPALSLALSGRGIAVGSIDGANNQLAPSSNRAGAARDFYLVAPGVSIDTVALGGGVSTWSGTSLAAPHVSGAAATLIQAFPYLTASQVIDILLRSATDLGAPGTDAIYGRGLVNLAAAMSPLGTLTVPTGSTVSSGGAALTTTSAKLGPAFGDALSSASVLKRAIVLDDYGRAYKADLSTHVQRADAAPAVAEWIRPRNDYRSASVQFDSGAALSLAFGEPRLSSADQGDERIQEVPNTFAFAATLPSGYSFGVTRGLGLSGSLGFSGGFQNETADLLAASGLTSPFLSLADQGIAAAFGADLGYFGLRFGVAGADDPMGTAARASAQVAEIGHTFANGATLNWQFGQLTEQGAILRSRGEGAYDLGEGASRFTGWFASVPLAARSKLVGSYMTGFSSVDRSEGLFREFSGVRSDAFSIGLFTTDVAAVHDRIGLIVSQPLRVTSGATRVAVPVGRSMDGTIVYADERIDLAPRGREIDFEVAYKLWLNGAADLSTSTLLQLEPGHVQDAEPALFNGIRIRVKL